MIGLNIVGATVRVLDTLDDTPLVPGLPEPAEQFGPRELIVLELATDEGIVGLGLTYWHGAFAPALRLAVDALAAAAIGEDPLRIERLTGKLARAVGRTSAGGSGIFHLALAALDLACWDIKGKHCGQPVAALVGGHRDRVAAYASGALLRGTTVDTLAQAAAALAKLGFVQMKMQCGSERTDRESVDRVRAVRDAVGPEVDVLLDVNQLWSAAQAKALGRRMEEYRLGWIEDPVPPSDLSGLASIRAALATPVVAGEYLYGIAPFQRLVEHRAVDVVMVDVLRVGGITGWLKVAGLSQAADLPVVSHRLPEVDVHLVAGVPNGLTVEYRPLTSGLFEETPRLDMGQLVVPDRPGLGLALRSEAIERYQVAEIVR